ncbi:MAG TPA: hypothetical protein VMZ25_00235 [Terriglobales bacterium]|nr:hypothetical protein [Terriglobales bacterium]
MTDPSNSSPKHGSSPRGTDQLPDPSVSQADGTAADAPRGETQAQPQSGAKSDPKVKSQTPENREGKINPSAPNDANSQMPANTTRDSAGEVGEPTGEGTLDAPKEGEQPKKKEQEEAA